MEATTSSWVCSTLAGVARSERLDVHHSDFAPLLGHIGEEPKSELLFAMLWLNGIVSVNSCIFPTMLTISLDVYGPYKTSISHRQAIAYLGSAGHP